MYGLSNGMIANDEVRLKVTFAVLNLCNTHNAGNRACFNYIVFTYKLKAHAGVI